MTAAAPVLELKGIRRWFGGMKAVDGIDLTVPQGDIVAIIGPNGAGKSTLFNVIAGQLRPTGGEVHFEGQAITGLSAHERTRLGIGRSFQITRVFPALTGLQNVQVPLLGSQRNALKHYLFPATRQQKERALQRLEEVGLGAVADRKAGTLAHGDKKRLELAIVLAMEPRMLLLDEPTAGMASEERISIMKLVGSVVRRRGLTMVFTEHDMDTVFDNAPRVLVMDRGIKLAEGSPMEIRNDQRVQEVYLGRRYRGELLA